MKRYKVTGNGVTLYSGTFDLNNEQVRARFHNLKPKGKNWEIINPVQFKRGEEFGWDGDPGKVLIEDITPVEKQSRKVKNLLYPIDEAVELIAAAMNVDELNEIVKGDLRPEIIEAAEKRKAEF